MNGLEDDMATYDRLLRLGVFAEISTEHQSMQRGADELVRQWMLAGLADSATHEAPEPERAP